MNKKSQHEILGFVLIVVIVSIIGVVFLALSFSKDSPKQTSIEISNLLQSSMYYTTDCAVNYIPQYRDIQDLIKECYKNENEKCLNGEYVCEKLEREIEYLIDLGLDVGEERVNKAYVLDVYYTPLDEIENREDILYLEKGIFQNCSYLTGGSHSILVSRFGYGSINLELEVCRN